MSALYDIPTVRDVWRLALPLGTRLVAGTEALRRPVRWARTSSHNPPLFPGLSAEELAVLDLDAARSFNPSLTLARVVSSLAKVPVSTLAVMQPAETKARVIADDVAMALFELPAGADAQRVARAVVRLLSDPEAQEESRAAEVLRRLMGLVTGSGGLQTVLADVASLSGHTVELELADGTVLRQVSPGGASGEQRDTQTVQAPIVVGEQAIGVVRLIDVGTSLDEFSRLLAAQSAAALAVELAKQQAVTEAQQALQADLLDAVLANEAPGVVRARARSLGYDLDVSHLVVVAEADVAATVLASWGRRVADLTKRYGWEALAAPHEGRLVLLAGSSNGRFAGDASWLDEVRTTWTSGPLTLSVGEPGEGLKGLKQSLAQAEDALALGVRLFGSGRTFRYSDLGVYRLFRHLQGRRELIDFYDRTLTPLVAYDTEHGTEMVATIQALFAHGGNVSRAAEALHLHRNSLSYRIDRVREIAGLDPLDPDDAFHLRLALFLAPLVDQTSR